MIVQPIRSSGCLFFFPSSFVRLPSVSSIVLLASATIAMPAQAQQRTGARASAPYVPGPTWERRDPAAAGFDAARLTEAIQFAIQADAKAPRDMEVSHYQSFGREPYGQGIGPFKPRGEPTGVILRGGYVVATWGEPDRVDMTHSVTKSFLSSVIGVAFDRGLIPSVRDTVWKAMAPIYRLRLEAPSEPGTTAGESYFIDPFATPHNREITWDDLLRQTSDWEGTLWGKPDWADRPGPPAEWLTRTRNAPGTSYKYNDVRVNVLALAALNVWRRPLPEVLKETVMDPIGASNTWRWFGYESSWVVLDGKLVQSVSGGGHWGGGAYMSAYDMARFGYLTLRRGKWKDRQVLSERWVESALEPTAVEPGYGFMNWFLNTDRKLYPSAPAKAFAHIGNGTNLVYVDPEHDIVAVVRWIDSRSIDGFLKRLLASLPP